MNMKNDILVDSDVIKGPSFPCEDGITVNGPSKMTAIRSVFDFRDTSKEIQDEVISGVKGAEVLLEGCVILGGIKALLCGNSDHPCTDFQSARWELNNCVIIGAGRRCPEAQDGTKVFMRNCWVHNWGRAFDIRSFGAWAHRGGVIIAEDCLFTQSGGIFSLGLITTIRDCLAHVGQVWKDYGPLSVLSPRSWIPGICRGLTADTGGLVLASRYYKNHWWIRLENAEYPMDRKKVISIVSEIEKACPDMTEYLGMGISAYFEQELS